MRGVMMSGGLTTYVVVEPVFPFELRSLLLHAASVGKPAQFIAQVVDDLNQPATQHTFTVRVKEAQFDAPASFDVIDQDNHLIQIKLPEFGQVEFDVYT